LDEVELDPDFDEDIIIKISQGEYQ